jgi:hypothetical protein
MALEESGAISQEADKYLPDLKNNEITAAKESPKGTNSAVTSYFDESDDTEISDSYEYPESEMS